VLVDRYCKCETTIRMHRMLAHSAHNKFSIFSEGNYVVACDLLSSDMRRPFTHGFQYAFCKRVSCDLYHHSLLCRSEFGAKDEKWSNRLKTHSIHCSGKLSNGIRVPWRQTKRHQKILQAVARTTTHTNINALLKKSTKIFNLRRCPAKQLLLNTDVIVILQANKQSVKTAS